MAALNQSPSGFSYAQAAKGRASAASSQAPSSKVTSGTATPATGTFSELGPASNWADDVEATVGEKTTDSKKVTQEQVKTTPVKDSAVERAKSESRLPNGTSAVSSPDIAAATPPSTAANTDETSSAAAGATPSDTTWDSKSQNSEPAWIAERKERQSHEEQPNGKRGKKERKENKDSKEPALPQPPKPVVLQEAPPPMVNPWAKRMEVAKAKTPTSPAANSAQKPSAPPQHVQNDAQRPRADSRRKANSPASVAPETESPVEDAKKAAPPQGKRGNDGRSDVRQSSKRTTDDNAAVTGKPVQREHQSLPNLTAIPPPVKDETSWPTPEHAQDKERKDQTAEKEAKEIDENAESESASNKTREKPQWKVIPITPTIVWETQEMNKPRQSGERGGRGGTPRGGGRGGFRGAPNGTKGDRAATKSNGMASEGENGSAAGQRGRAETTSREAMPPPPKAGRPSSTNGSGERRRNHDQSSVEHQTNGKTIGGNGEETANASAGASISDSRQEVKIPEPIPRQGASAAQLDESHDASHDGPSIRRVPSDGKKEARAFDGYTGKDYNGTPRGGKRSGRGRGGSREYTNGHQASNGYVNGHGEYAGLPYGVPPSPSGYQTPRGQFNPPPQGGRGSWRGNPRSHSIPVDNLYGGRPYWPQQQLQQMQPYFPGMWDGNGGATMSAMPYNPGFVDHQYLMDMVRTQLEYYFSIDNLLKDMFLRKHMDSQGFVFLDFIADFNRIKNLTVDKDLLRAVCLRSDQIEIRIGDDGKERLRKTEGWEQFLLPKDQRDQTAQNDGPSGLQRPELPHLQMFPGHAAFRGPQSAGLPGSQRRSYDSGHALNGAVPQFAPFSALAESGYGDFSNGEEFRGRATKSPIRENSVSPSHPSPSEFADHKDSEPDVFPNEHQDALTVVVKMNPQRASHHHAATRTFSNGSIDTRSIFSEIEKPMESYTPSVANGEPLVNGDGAHADTPRHASPGIGRTPDKGQMNPDLMLLWVKDKELPQGNVPSDATLEPYLSLREKALGQRREAATGTCPYDLDVLYQFWSHFLIRNFNKNMYGEFRHYAHDDANDRHSIVGLQNLVQFYAKALVSSNTIRDSIVKDYVALVKDEPSILQGLALKQLRQAWRNGALNLKNRKKVSDILDEELKASLEKTS